MKNTLSNFLIFSVIGLSLIIFSRCSSLPDETENALEKRLDAIIYEMSVQEQIEQLYYNTDGNARMGIPQFTGSDGPHGIGNRARGFSSFAVTIARAASWDTDLTFRVGRAISLEQSARKRHRVAGPALDLLHDPRNGRASETIGEDPFLGGRISEAFVLGQNSTAVFGSIKHYNLNTFEAGRRTNNYKIDRRSLIEFWGHHWKRAVQDGGGMSVMCAYNLVNGERSAENYTMIKTALRDHWGFNFYTMCDWGGFSDTQRAINSELDFCEGNDLYFNELPGLVAAGIIDSSLVENATRNVLRTKVLAGMLDGHPDVPISIIDSREHRELVYESGLKSLILLKNEDAILPLDQGRIKTVGLVGPNAAVLPLDGNSSSAVIPSYTITVKQALDSLLGEDRIRYLKGCNINDSDKSGFRAAIDLAKEVDYVVFVGGLDSTQEGEEHFTGGDRVGGSTRLPGLQNELINALADVNPNIILVVISGGTCSVNPVIDNIKGLVYAFYPGQEGGRAITDVLLGNYNPSGKMPVTMPGHDEDLPATDMNFSNVVYKGVGYRWNDSQQIEPEYAFGYGLSYTTFAYSNISLSSDVAALGEEITVKFDVTNTGDRAGEEVSQLYLSTGRLGLDIQMPVKQLKGFTKVKLQPGETKTIEIVLSPEELYIYDEIYSGYRVVSGEYIVKIGGSSDNLPLEASFLYEDSVLKPDLLVKNIRTMPVFPKEGDEVIFMASLLNRGTIRTDIGDMHDVRFYLNGQEVAVYRSKTQSIPVGGMELVVGEGNWTAGDGLFTITAKVDVANRIKETNETNNTTKAVLSLPDGKVVPIEWEKYVGNFAY
jgi:beta-glucosidase